MLKVNLPLLLGCALITALPEADNDYRYDYINFFAQRFDYENYSQTVKDLKTGLEWQRCPEGQLIKRCNIGKRDYKTCPDVEFYQDFSGGEESVLTYSSYCSGKATSMTFEEAEELVENKANGWRVPTLYELMSIIDTGSTPAIYHWTSADIGKTDQTYPEDTLKRQEETFNKHGNPFPLGAATDNENDITFRYYMSSTAADVKIIGRSSKTQQFFYVDFEMGEIEGLSGNEGGVHLRLVKDAN